MAFERDAHLRIGPQKFRILGQDVASVAAEIGFIEVEVGILHVLVEQIADSLLRGRLLRLPGIYVHVALAVALPPAPVAVIV